MHAHAGTDPHADIRDAVAKLCAAFPGEYWRKLDRTMSYPTAFVEALTHSGFLSALIPEEYGGAGLRLSAAAALLEEVQRAGCNGGACHAQMYVMGTVLRHGSEEQKRKYLPGVASGKLRLQAFGDDTVSIKAFGLDVVTDLCARLLEGGAPALHFYTMNQSAATLEISRRLGLDATP